MANLDLVLRHLEKLGTKNPGEIREKPGDRRNVPRFFRTNLGIFDPSFPEISLRSILRHVFLILSLMARLPRVVAGGCSPSCYPARECPTSYLLRDADRITYLQDKKQESCVSN